MASKRIKGITIELGSDTVGLEKALSDVNKQSSKLQSELRDVERLLKFNPGNAEALAQKQKLLTDQVENTTNKLNQLKEAEKQVQQQFKKGEISEEQYRGFKREIVETESKLKHFENQLEDTNNAMKQNGANVKKLGKDYQESFDKVKQAGTTLTAVGGVIAGGLGIAVKTAADSETQLAKMETAMQGNIAAAKEYLEWAKQFGKTTPFEAADVVDASIKLKSYGIEAKDTLTSIGNMAAGMGKGLDQAVEAVADAQTGELERLKEFGITKQMLIDKALELGKGEIVNAKGQITDMAALNDALFAIMDERFKGGMERQSKTLNGQLSALKDSFTQILTAIGEVLFPIVSKMTGFLQQMADSFNNLSPGMQTIIAISAAVAAAIALIGGPLLILIGFIPQIIAGFTAIGPVFAALTGPIGLVVAAVVGLIAILVALYKNNEDFRNKVIEIWNSIQNAFKTSMDFIMNIVKSVMTSVMAFVSDILEKLKAFWKENGDEIMAIVRLYMDFIGAHIKMVMGIIQGVFQMVWPIITGIIKVAWASIQITIKNTLDIILGIIQFFIKIFTGDWEGAFETIKQTAINIMNNIVETFKSINLLQIGKDIVQGLIDGIDSMATAVWEKVKSIAESVKEAFQEMLDIHSPSRVFKGFGININEGLIEGIQASTSQLNRAMENVYGSLANSAGRMMQVNSAPTQSIFQQAPIYQPTLQPVIFQTFLDGKLVAEQTYPDINRMLHNDMRVADRTGGSWKKL